MPSQLFPGEKVYDDSNFQELIGDGVSVFAGGEQRWLSRIEPTAQQIAKSYGHRASLESAFKIIDRSNLSAAIKEKEDRQSRISDWQNFPPMDQDGLPICWTQGDCCAATTLRVMSGLPYVEMSGSSLAVPISGGNSGGWEGDALDYAAEHGIASVDVWPNVAANRSYMNKPEVIASRKLHMTLEAMKISERDRGQRFLAFATALLNNLPCPFAYNWMSHVMTLVDVVEIEAGSFGFRVRNSWGNWGAKNKYGFYGYNVYREGKGTPDSGHAVRQVTVSPK